MIGVMNLIWAFDFSHATDPVTGDKIPVDTLAYEKVVFDESFTQRLTAEK